MLTTHFLLLGVAAFPIVKSFPRSNQFCFYFKMHAANLWALLDPRWKDKVKSFCLYKVSHMADEWDLASNIPLVFDLLQVQPS